MKHITLDLYSGEVYGVHGWGAYTNHVLPRYVKVWIKQYNPQVNTCLDTEKRCWKVTSYDRTSRVFTDLGIQEIKIPDELWEEVVQFQVYNKLTQ